MKILHVIPNPFFIERGSLIRAWRQILIARDAAAQCHIVCYHLGKNIPGVSIHRIPTIPWYKNLASGANIHRLYLDLLLMTTMFRVVRTVKPDIIHAHLHEGVFAALPIARLYRIPLLFDAEGSLSEEMAAYRFFGAGLFKPLERYLNGKADFVMTSSRQLFEKMHTEFNVPEKRLILFEDFIDTRLFSPRCPDRERAEQLGIPAGAPVVAYIGLLDALQNIDAMFIAIKIISARVPQAHFLIMGFPHAKSWERQFRENGVHNAHFPGLVERDDAPSYLSLGTVGISAKHSGVSQGHGKLLDYMAMRLPVVVFDNAVNRDILGPFGRYAPENDIDRFAEAIIDYLQNVAASRKIGEELRKRVCERFSLERQGSRLMELYASIIDRHRPAPQSIVS
jgi:glycosyltransferase involved in cell wall biosynthesis